MSSAADPDTSSGTVDDACAFSAVDSYSTGYHIGAVFIILAASVIGTCIPIVGAYFPAMQRYPFVYTCGKHIGTGVLVALSLIHLLAPAFDELGSTCLPNAFQTYEYAPLFCMLAALCMQFMELMAFDHAKRNFEGMHTQPQSGDVAMTGNGNGQQYLVNNSGETPYTGNGGGGDMMPVPSKDVYSSNDVEKRIPNVDKLERGENAATSLADGATLPQAHGHEHGLFMGATSIESLRKMVAAYLLEFGCTSHSVIIGISVGVADDSTTNTLLAALVFHQFFEGFALGARIKAVGFSKFTEMLFATIYSTAAPIGIAIGIGIVGTYNGSGSTANLVQGTFDAVSAGIILYVAFVQMVGGDFAADYMSFSGQPIKQISLWVCLWTGAAVMAIIGIWL